MANAEPSRGHRPRIIRDESPASSGASSAQRVVIGRPGGEEVPAHAKFAKDASGAVVAERGEQGLAAELLASHLGGLVGALTPTVEAVELESVIEVRLSGGRLAAPGLAIASHTIDRATDVNNAAAIADIDPEELACIAVFHAWAEVSDRGHNLIRSGEHAYSIDHATAFGSAWAAVPPSAQFAPDGLIGPNLVGREDAIRSAADRLSRISGEQIEQAVEQLPREFVPSDEVRGWLVRNLKISRQQVIDAIARTYPAGKEA